MYIYIIFMYKNKPNVAGPTEADSSSSCREILRILLTLHVFTTFRHFSLFFTRLIHPTPFLIVFFFSVLSWLVHLGLQNVIFSSGGPHQNSVRISLITHTNHMPLVIKFGTLSRHAKFVL